MIIENFTGYSPATLADIHQRLANIDIKPNEEIGQHFLVNQGAIDMLARSVSQGSTVLEVGSGPGHVTERLAEQAFRLHGIEIDRRYRPLLDRVTAMHTNTNIIFGDALAIGFKQLLDTNKGSEGQIVASLPYHIIEPFIQKVAPENLASVTLVVGRRYADSLSASLSSAEFGKLSILTATFFDVETLATIQRDGFFPIPRTDSAIVQLRPRDPKEIASTRRDVVFRHLFLTSRQNSTLRKGLKEGFDAFEQSKDGAGLSKRERNHKSRSSTKVRLKEVLEEINKGVNHGDQSDDSDVVGRSISNISRDNILKLNIPSITLDKPFTVLNNSELRKLYEILS